MSITTGSTTDPGGYWVTTSTGPAYIGHATISSGSGVPVPSSPSADAYLLHALENRLGAMEKQIAALADNLETIKDALLAILERDRHLTEQRECRPIAALPSEDLWDAHNGAS